MPLDLPNWASNGFFPINRWVHMVAMTMLVGGVFFFEFVVPLATSDLKEEQQLAVFGRARWVFKKIVWYSIAALLISGALSMWRMWWIYAGDARQIGSYWQGSLPWAIGHVALAIIGFGMVLRVVATHRLRGNPLAWLRATLVVLLISIFVVCVARQVRMRLRELRELHHAPADVHQNDIS